MILVVDYGAGNLHSVEACLRRIGVQDCCVSANPEDIAKATAIILPGVGAFADCMQGLHNSGAMPALYERVHTHTTPFLGICVGMQLLFSRGHEHGVHAGLGWIEGDVVALEPTDASIKIPHMGWNALEFSANSVLFSGVEAGAHAYFVHSYHAVATDDRCVIATTHHGQNVTAAVQKGHIFGTQFHPEKSQRVGEKILHNFVDFAKQHG